MNWFYESDGKQQGPVSEHELDRLLAEGKITPNTLVWHDPLPDWQPLRIARPAPVPPPLSSAIGDVPAGHVRCTSTGKVIPESEAVFVAGKPYCPEARPVAPTIGGFQSTELESVGDDETRTGPPWERRSEIGFVRAVLETISGVLLQPTQTFANMRRTGGIGTPLSYYVLIAYIGSAVSLFYSVYLERLNPGLQQFPWASQAAQVPTSTRVVATLFAMLFLVPLMSFVQAGVVHLFLMMFGGAKQGFETTYRVGCYVWGSTAVFYLLPMCGQFVAVIWAIVSMILGLAAAHQTDTGRATGAVLAPFVVCCGLAVVFSALIVAAASNLMQTQ